MKIRNAYEVEWHCILVIWLTLDEDLGLNSAHLELGHVFGGINYVTIFVQIWEQRPGANFIAQQERTHDIFFNSQVAAIRDFGWD
jgi:hypothetical protein